MSDYDPDKVDVVFKQLQEMEDMSDDYIRQDFRRFINQYNNWLGRKILQYRLKCALSGQKKQFNEFLDDPDSFLTIYVCNRMLVQLDRQLEILSEMYI
jgi:hypothetical protein